MAAASWYSGAQSRAKVCAWVWEGLGLENLLRAKSGTLFPLEVRELACDMLQFCSTPVCQGSC